MRILLFLISFNVFAVDNVLVLDNVHGKIIKGGTYSSATGNCITVTNSTDVIIQDATFIGCWLNGVAISNSVNVSVLRNYFEDTGGAVYYLSSAGIVVTDNKSKNTKRRAGSARGQSIVQINLSYGMGGLIANNYSLDDPAIATREDAINIYASYFSTSHPLIIENNIIKGSGTSTAGTGIVVGDGGGSDVIVRNNKLYNSGSGGVAAAGGQRITLENNLIYGAQSSITQIGLFAAKKPNTHPAPCTDLVVKNNTIDWTKFNGVKNSHWTDYTTCTFKEVSGQVNNVDLSGMALPTF